MESMVRQFLQLMGLGEPLAPPAERTVSGAVAVVFQCQGEMLRGGPAHEVVDKIVDWVFQQIKSQGPDESLRVLMTSFASEAFQHVARYSNDLPGTGWQLHELIRPGTRDEQWKKQARA